MEKLVIKIDELPARANRLSPEYYNIVFGGCVGEGGSTANGCYRCCEGLYPVLQGGDNVGYDYYCEDVW